VRAATGYAMSAAAGEALVLFAHGAREHAGRIAFRARAGNAYHAGDASVRTAFLELQTPTLLEALEAAAAEGARRVHVVPVFWPRRPHRKRFTADPRHVQCPTPSGGGPRLPGLSELPGMLEFVARTVAQSSYVYMPMGRRHLDAFFGPGRTRSLSTTLMHTV